MSAKLKPSTKVYEKNSRGKMTNKWRIQHHNPNELISMYNDKNFRKKKHLILIELKKRGVTL